MYCWENNIGSKVFVDAMIKLHCTVNKSKHDAQGIAKLRTSYKDVPLPATTNVRRLGSVKNCLSKNMVIVGPLYGQTRPF